MIYITFFIVILIDKRGVREAVRGGKRRKEREREAERDTNTDTNTEPTTDERDRKKRYDPEPTPPREGRGKRGKHRLP